MDCRLGKLQMNCPLDDKWSCPDLSPWVGKGLRWKLKELSGQDKSTIQFLSSHGFYVIKLTVVGQCKWNICRWSTINYSRKIFFKKWLSEEDVPVFSSVERVEMLISCSSSSVSVWKRRMDEPSENAIHTPPPAHAMCATLTIGSGWTSNFCDGHSNRL